MKFIIRSVFREEPNCFFAAIHSFTPFYGTRDKARRFPTLADAEAYAEAELFTDDSAYEVEPVLGERV
jgi:predicted N-formylglutamate amidohydrolase